MCEKDNLELYLYDVFDKECVFKIEQDEVHFIQSGIEHLVQRIVDLVLADLRTNKKTDMYLSCSCILQNSDIIKVGSFYEGTKNKFPDEFDIIFCFYEMKYGPFSTLLPVTDLIKQVCCRHRRALRYQDNYRQKQRICYEKYVDKHGPAAWLRFIYTSKSGERKYINVDLVPASRIYITEREHTSAVTETCLLEPFRQEVLSTGSVLLVGDNYSFTETEVHFMRNVLSKNHVKVYRILKQLINGHSDEAVSSDLTMSCYTSYVIKSTVIYHHYSCKSSILADSPVGPCLLQILEKLCTFDYDTEIPRLAKNRSRGETVLFAECFSDLFLKSYLKSMITKLRSMQNSRGVYKYENDRIKKSLLEQYLDEKGKQELDIKFCTLL